MGASFEAGAPATPSAARRSTAISPSRDRSPELTDPLSALAGVGPRTAAGLGELGVECVGDLLRHLPAGYLDRRSPVDPAAASPGPGAVVGTVESVRWLRLRGRRGGLTVARVAGGGSALEVRWHGRPWLRDRLDVGAQVLLLGEVRRAKRGSGLEMLDPALETPSAETGDLISPVYPGLGSQGPARVAKLVAQAAGALDPARVPEDPIPAPLLEGHRLPPLAEALAEVHRPSPEADVAALRRRTSAAWARLLYGDLLAEQLALARRRRDRRACRPPHRFHLPQALREELLRLAPFALTEAQTRVVDEIFDDLERPWPMARLLQGDVGCGKTAVALLALAAAAANGLRGVWMAPTEVLAEQVFRVARGWFGERWPVALHTASSRAAAAAPVIVGTHALLEAGAVEGGGAEDLALVVIDEQHRFGVEQRRRLVERGSAPDLLLMSATPIPRSLALTRHGDLDLSRIDQAPPGRAGATTDVWPRRRRLRAYRRLADALEAGAQAYVVVPAIEAGEASLAATVDRLAEPLARWPGGVLHGRLPSAEQLDVLDRFTTGELRWLLATTVVEVGLDVPAATAMVIEGAERFGLAQLHQLRGRVGRGAVPGWCLALHGPVDGEA
ncbi:MAG: DEAD/DEAH box helicase, partial [Acidobacteria bacterium]|nr:DEAD/DEAH box helicase [Acidobacteriota bacterium]